MFGLEKIGFSLCLVLILIFACIILYYCKSKNKKTEHKVTAIFKLVTELHTEIEQLKSHIQSPPHEHHEQEELHEQEYGEDHGEEEHHREEHHEQGFTNHPYKELIPNTINVVELSDVSDSSESESDEDDDDVHDEHENIKSIPFDMVPVEVLLDDISKSNLPIDEHENIKSVPLEINDYSKMSVAELRKLVTERNLSSAPSKLRNTEFLKLFQ